MPAVLRGAELSCSGKDPLPTRPSDPCQEHERMRSTAWPWEVPPRSWKLLLDPSLASLVLPKCLPHISAGTRSVLGPTCGC